MMKTLFAIVLLVVAHAKVIQKDSRKQKWNKSDLPSSKEVFNAADTTQPACMFQEGEAVGENLVNMPSGKDETECVAKCYELQKVNPNINGVVTDVKTGKECICAQVMVSRSTSNIWKSCFIPFKNDNPKIIFKGLLKNELDACLNEHNRLRALHVDTPPLVLDDKLTESAQKVAEYLALTDTFEHNDNLPYGENLYQGGGSCIRATNKWYEEIKDYNYANPDYSKMIGHFIQVVYKTARKVGFGLATINGVNKVVAEYENIKGAGKKVMPLKTNS